MTDREAFARVYRYAQRYCAQARRREEIPDIEREGMRRLMQAIGARARAEELAWERAEAKATLTREVV